MPYYEYHCVEGHTFKRFSMSEARDKQTCHCGIPAHREAGGVNILTPHAFRLSDELPTPDSIDMKKWADEYDKRESAEVKPVSAYTEAHDGI